MKQIKITNPKLDNHGVMKYDLEVDGNRKRSGYEYDSLQKYIVYQFDGDDWYTEEGSMKGCSVAELKVTLKKQREKRFKSITIKLKVLDNPTKRQHFIKGYCPNQEDSINCHSNLLRFKIDIISVAESYSSLRKLETQLDNYSPLEDTIYLVVLVSNEFESMGMIDRIIDHTSHLDKAKELVNTLGGFANVINLNDKYDSKGILKYLMEY